MLGLHINILYIKNCKQCIQCCISDRYKTAKNLKKIKARTLCVSLDIYTDVSVNVSANALLCAYTFYFCGFISVAYTTLNKLLAVFFNIK